MTVSSPTPIYHGTNHTFTCQTSYDSTVVTVSVVYSWTGPNGSLIAGDGVTLSPDNSLLILSPVDRPQLSSGGYTCTISLLPSDPAFINQVSASDTVSVTVLGEGG